MSVEVRVPEIGESIEEVTVDRWLKKEGDSIEKDEAIVVLDSDKTSVDLPSPEAGVLEAIEVKEGEDASVGDVLCRIGTGGANGKGSRGSKPKETEDTAEPDSKKSGGDEAGPKTSGAKSAGEEEAGRKTREAAGEREAEGAGDDRPRQKKKESKEASGKKKPDTEAGRAESDDRKEAESREDRRPEPAAPASEDRPDGHERREKAVPMSPIRRKIAEHLVRAQQNAALLTTFNRIDMSRVIEMRKRYREAFEERHGVRLGLMSFFVKASVEALKQIPELNAEIRDDRIVYRNYFDIGIAIGSKKGLVVPILRDAQRLGFAEIELRIKDFAERADQKRLKVEELEGGTFTISNGGVYGSLLSTPIVNAPQSGVLGLHAISDEAVVIDGEIVVRPMMNVALSYDHRIVDGREAVIFLRTIKERVEDPASVLLGL